MIDEDKNVICSKCPKRKLMATISNIHIDWRDCTFECSVKDAEEDQSDGTD